MNAHATQEQGRHLALFHCTIAAHGQIGGVGGSRLGVDLAEVRNGPFVEFLDIDEDALKVDALGGKLLQLALNPLFPTGVGVVDAGSANLPEPGVVFLCNPDNAQVFYWHGFTLSLRCGAATIAGGAGESTPCPKGETGGV